ncbi:hypothetical protein M0802_001828 [Mischocyttarus mexicanus]|nr:hypothetical protein M0802_001828 [Mischocyttarus mexicanus]
MSATLKEAGAISGGRKIIGALKDGSKKCNNACYASTSRSYKPFFNVEYVVTDKRKDTRIKVSKRILGVESLKKTVKPKG